MLEWEAYNAALALFFGVFFEDVQWERLTIESMQLCMYPARYMVQLPTSGEQPT